MEILKYDNYLDNIQQNKLKRCKKSQEFFKELTPLPRGVKAWAKNSVFGYEAYFDVENRNKGVCSKCGNEFTPTSPLVSRRSYSCPHCHATLTAVTNTQLKCCKGKGFQVLSLFGDKVVVRHFIITRTHYTGDYEAKWSFYEYERDVMTPNDNYLFQYYIKKWIDSENFYWKNKKPYQGSHLMWTLPNLFYEDEPLYRGNVSEVLKDTPYRYSGIEYLPKGDKLRAEEYLCTYTMYPCMEQLVKAGFSKLAKSCSDISCYDKVIIPAANATDIPSIFAHMPLQWREYVKAHGFGYKLANAVLQYFEKGLKLSDFDAAYRYWFDVRFNRENTPEMLLNTYVKIQAYTSFNAFLKYVSKHNVRLSDYSDYVRMYGMLINHEWNKSALFPKDFTTAHDNASKAYQVKKDELKETALKCLYDKCFKAIDRTVIGDFMFVCPKTVEDFILEGKNNANCVAGYADITAEGNGRVVVFMRQKDAPEKSFVTIEYRINCGKIHMAQCRGYHNHETTQEQKQAALKFAPLVLKNYQYQMAA